MIRWWGGLIWVFVGAMAIAVAVQALVLRDASGAPAVAGLRLSEILAGPARDWDGDGLYDSKSDEWVEVENAGSTPIGLEDYRLADADRTIRFALSGTLQPGEVRLIAGSAAVVWQRTQGLSTAGLSLNNAGDTVFLLQILGTDTLTIDAHTYGSIEGATDRSVGRSGPQGQDWILFDALNPYSGSGTPPGTGCAPFLRLHAKVPRSPAKPIGYPYHPVTLGQHLRRTRVDRGLSRAELAAHLCVHPETIRYWETGRTKPTVRLYPWVVAFLGREVEDTPFTIGAAVRRKRRSLGLSQRALAGALHIAPSTVWRIESRRHGPERRTLQKLRAWVSTSANRRSDD